MFCIQKKKSKLNSDENQHGKPRPGRRALSSFNWFAQNKIKNKNNQQELILMYVVVLAIAASQTIQNILSRCVGSRCEVFNRKKPQPSITKSRINALI